MTTIIDEDLNAVIEAQEEDSEEEVASLEHGIIASNLNANLWIYLRQYEIGEVFDSQTTFRFKGKKSNRQPDIAFVLNEHLPENLRDEADFAPDFAAEVVSKNDKDFNIEEKVLQYQKSGVRLVWIIHSFSRTVEVFRLETGLRSQRFVGSDELDGGSVIPGFKITVEALFARVPVMDDEDDLAE